MAAERPSGRDSAVPRGRRILDLSGSASRYDLALATIPLAFLLGAIAHLVSPVPLRVALAAGATVGLLVLVDAVFLNPPGETPPS